MACSSPASATVCSSWLAGDSLTLSPDSHLCKSIQDWPTPIVRKISFDLDADEKPSDLTPKVLEALGWMRNRSIITDLEIRGWMAAVAEGFGSDNIKFARVVKGLTYPTLGSWLRKPGDGFDAAGNAPYVLKVPPESDFSLDVNQNLKVVLQQMPNWDLVISPNTTDGSICDDETQSKILKLPIPVILDEAYKGYSTKMTCMKKFENLNVLPTFSKSDGIDHPNDDDDDDAKSPRQSPGDENGGADPHTPNGEPIGTNQQTPHADPNRSTGERERTNDANHGRNEGNADPESGITSAPNGKMLVTFMIAFLAALAAELITFALTHSSKHSWVNYFKWIGVLVGFVIGVAGLGVFRYRSTLGKYVMGAGAVLSFITLIITLISSL